MSTTKPTPDVTAQKETNPKDAVGTAKVPISCVPLRVLGELGLAMFEGARKYGRFNWRVAGVRASVYLDAAVMRHIAPWWEGQDIDPDSGIHHLTKAIACLTVVRDSLMQGNCVDDRPPKADPNWLQDQNATAKAIIERTPDARAPFTALMQGEPTPEASNGGVEPDDVLEACANAHRFWTLCCGNLDSSRHHCYRDCGHTGDHVYACCADSKCSGIRRWSP